MTISTYQWAIDRYHQALEIKSKIYAEVNIVEYWVINLRDKQLIVFREPVNGEYRA